MTLEVGTKVKNVHTGEDLTIVDIDHVNVSSHSDVQPIYVLSDGKRWNQDQLAQHWRVVDD